MVQINNPNAAAGPADSAAQQNGPTIGGGLGAGAGLGAAPNVEGRSQATGLSAQSFLQIYQVGAVPKNIEEYTNNVTEAMKKLLSRIPTGGLYNITRKLLSVPTGAIAFVTTGINGHKYGFITVFRELLGTENPNHEPPVNSLTQAAEQLLQLEPGIKLRGGVIVTPDMYERVEQMAGAVIKSFMMRVDPAAIATTARSLCSTLEFVVGTDLETAQRFESMRSPHGVRPAADIGLWVGLRLKRNTASLSGSVLGNNSGTDVVPFLSVLAIVDVMGPIRGSEKMMPLVRITDVTTDIMHPGVLYMGLQLAVEYFGNNAMWKQPLRNYGAGGMNIGTLSYSEDGKSLYRCKNDADTEDFIAKYLVDALICVDVALGRFRIPELFDFTQEDQLPIKQAVSAFFGNIAIPGNDQLGRCSQLLGVDYIGYYGAAGAEVDSRRATYLRMTEGHAVSQDTKRTLLAYGATQERANLIASMSGGTFNSLYLCYTEILSGPFIGWIAGAMNAMQVRLVDPNGNSRGGIQLSAQIGVFGDYSGVGSTVTSPGRTIGGFASSIYG